MVWESSRPYEHTVMAKATGGAATLRGLTLRHYSKSVAQNYCVLAQARARGAARRRAARNTAAAGGAPASHGRLSPRPDLAPSGTWAHTHQYTHPRAVQRHPGYGRLRRDQQQRRRRRRGGCDPAAAGLIHPRLRAPRRRGVRRLRGCAPACAVRADCYRFVRAFSRGPRAPAAHARARAPPWPTPHASPPRAAAQARPGAASSWAAPSAATRRRACSCATAATRCCGRTR